MSYFVLNPDHSTREVSAVEWAMFFKEANRRVEFTHVGEYNISTVFLGLDHSFSSGGPPILFETMVFGPGECDGLQARYATWDEAVAGHERYRVAMLEKMLLLAPGFLSQESKDEH